MQFVTNETNMFQLHETMAPGLMKKMEAIRGNETPSTSLNSRVTKSSNAWPMNRSYVPHSKRDHNVPCKWAKICQASTA